MFKKLLALAMCLALLFVFVACGDENSSNDNESNKDTSSTASSDAPTFEGTVEEQIGKWAEYKKLIDLESKDSGRTIEITGRGDSLVYIYKYTISFTDPDTVFSNIEKSLNNKEQTFKEMHKELKKSVPTVTSVVVEYYTSDGQLALSKTFADGADTITGGEYASGLYGAWATDYDVSQGVVSMLRNEFGDGEFDVSGVNAKYIMEFYADGKCVVKMEAADAVYNALIDGAEKHLKSAYGDEADSKIADFKSRYTKEAIKAEMDVSEQGTYTVTGDVKTTGTLELGGENMEGVMKFIVDGNTLTLIPMANGEELQDSALVFNRK